MSDESELKHLQHEESCLKKSIKEKYHLKRSLQHDLEIEKDALKRIQKQLKASGSGGVIITEHAQLRYLERVTSIDLEMVKEGILPKDGVEVLKQFVFQDGLYPMGTHSFRLRDRPIVTIVTE